MARSGFRRPQKDELESSIAHLDLLAVGICGGRMRRALLVVKCCPDRVLSNGLINPG